MGMKKDFAIAQMGGVKALAGLLGVTRHAVYQWRDEVPQLQAFKLRDLRPDLFPPERKTAVPRRRAPAAAA